MKIHQLLEIDPFYYEEIILKTFLDYCFIRNTTAKSLQLALINKPLQNYFKTNYNALETQFKEELKGYEKLSKVDKMDLYTELTGAIFKNYPSALLPKLKAKDRLVTNFN